MSLRNRAARSYGAVKVEAGVTDADSVQLIQMLFDGLIESMIVAHSHIERGAIKDKAEALNRCSRIVVGLQSALDLERGGDLARNLGDLYAYVLRRLFHVNANNDLQALAEIRGLMTEIRDAWSLVPALVPQQSRRHSLEMAS